MQIRLQSYNKKVKNRAVKPKNKVWQVIIYKLLVTLPQKEAISGMSNNYFRFKQFSVSQELCAMKVGTDGTLLGAWAQIPDSSNCTVLDIGTGTGLIALMLAQRYSTAHITAIDINTDAVAQAKRNVELSPFFNRIEVEEGDAVSYRSAQPFDAIVSNPPFFEQSLVSPDPQRTLARHSEALTYSQLVTTAQRLLADEGLFSVIIPAGYRSRLESEAVMAGLFVSRCCAVKTTMRKPCKRLLYEFRKHPAGQVITEEEVLEDPPGARSEWYQKLTKEFYL